MFTFLHGKICRITYREKRLGEPTLLAVKQEEQPPAPAVPPLVPRDIGGSWSAPPTVNPAIWRASHQIKLHHAKSATSAAQKQREENKRLCDDVRNLTNQHQTNVNRRLCDRTCDVTFWLQELDRRHVELSEDVEAMKSLRDRLEKQHDNFFHPLHVAKQCIDIRNQRCGIELTEDEASTALRQEVQSLQRCRAILATAYKDSKFQIRKVLSCLYQLQKNVEEKRVALTVDSTVQDLTPTEPPSRIISSQEINPSPLTVDNWRTRCMNLVQRSEAEHNLSVQLIALAEALLTSTCREVKEAVNHTNESLRRRIEDSKNAKIKLEEEHAKLVQEESELTASLADMQTELEAKRDPLAIAQTRLDTRRRRPLCEQTSDEVEAALYNEIEELERSSKRLVSAMMTTQEKKNKVISWIKALEHDINLKVKSVHLDDVQVMVLRNTVLIEQS